MFLLQLDDRYWKGPGENEMRINLTLLLGIFGEDNLWEFLMLHRCVYVEQARN